MSFLLFIVTNFSNNICISRDCHISSFSLDIYLWRGSVWMEVHSTHIYVAFDIRVVSTVLTDREVRGYFKILNIFLFCTIICRILYINFLSSMRWRLSIIFEDLPVSQFSVAFNSVEIRRLYEVSTSANENSQNKKQI